jgi:hypothetical protein
VLLRGDEPKVEGKGERGEAKDMPEELGEAFPEEYRELARIYLRALLGAR